MEVVPPALYRESQTGQNCDCAEVRAAASAHTIPLSSSIRANLSPSGKIRDQQRLKTVAERDDLTVSIATVSSTTPALRGRRHLRVHHRRPVSAATTAVPAPASTAAFPLRTCFIYHQRAT